MSQSTLKLMKFLVGTRGAGYSRLRAARACDVSEATITRSLNQLSNNGAIERHRGGRSTPASINVLIGLQEFLSRQTKMSRQVVKNEPLSAENEPLSGRINISEEETQREHKATSSDDVEPVVSEEVRKAAGFEALSEGDRRYLAGVVAAGVSLAAILAGVLVGRARRLCSERNGSVAGGVRSVRYFAATIEQASKGQFSAGYVAHVENFIRRHSADGADNIRPFCRTSSQTTDTAAFANTAEEGYGGSPQRATACTTTKGVAIRQDQRKNLEPSVVLAKEPVRAGSSTIKSGGYLTRVSGTDAVRALSSPLVPARTPVPRGGVLSPQKKPPDIEHCDYSAQIADLARVKRIGGRS
jgi:hypothetical protein